MQDHSPIHRLLVCLVIVTVLVSATVCQANDFPLRPFYPEVPYITTDALLKNYDTTIVVDIRSSFEYDVAHINKATLLPLTDKSFSEKLKKLRAKEDSTPMAFYCNGHSCAKSYQAAQLAMSMGFENVFTYDGGIFDWIEAAPDKATLMGETPARGDRIISAEDFLHHQLGIDAFAYTAANPKAIVIDIRDPFQRETAPKVKGIRNIPLDALLELVTSRIWTEKRLLFFDAVGKQVRWLQYFLESYGYFDYYFLEDGMRGLENDPDWVRPVIDADRNIVSNQQMLLRLTSDKRLSNNDRRAVSYLLAHIKFNNYVVVKLKTAAPCMGAGGEMLLQSVERLSQFGYTTHAVMQGTLIVQLDPRLAWKGKAGSKLWKAKVKEFKTALKE